MKTPYEQHIDAVCNRIATKWDAGEAIDVSAINSRLEAGNPANWQIHALCAELGLSGFHRPRHELALNTAEFTRAKMRHEIRSAVNEILTWQRTGTGDAGPAGQHYAMQVDVGLGKTFTARQEVARFIAEARASGRPHRVLWLVPYHRLSDETLSEFERLAVNAMVWRGREATDPSLGMQMCPAHQVVRAAQAIQADVDRDVCGSDIGPQCPHRRGCLYLQQKLDAAHADVVIAANNALFTPVQTDQIGLVVIDEGFWQRGTVIGRDIVLSSVASDVRRFPVHTKGKIDQSATTDLYGWCAIVQSVANRCPENAFLTTDMFRSLLTAEDARAAVKLEWRRKIDVNGLLRPGMNSSESDAALHRASVNRTLARRVEMWRAIEAMLSGVEDGRLFVATDNSSSGSQAKLVLYGRQEIHDAIARLPIIHLDATLALDQIKVFLPHMRRAADLRAATPHQHITQVLSTVEKTGLPTGGFGKTSVIPSSGNSSEDQRRARRIRNLRDFIRLQVDGGTGLVVTYQGAESQFTGIPGVEVAHFNAIAGLDAFGSVDCLFVVGRPQASPEAHRALAVALTGKHPATIEMAPIVDHILMRDGGGTPISRMSFVDPFLESIRRAITDAEVVQAVGRARGVNRTAANPVQVFVFSDVVMPFAVDHLTTWRKITPDVVEKMLALGAALLSPSDAYRVYPNLFCSEGAARKALQRATATRGQNPIIGNCMDLSPCAVLIRYQARGARQRPREALCTPARVNWLRDQLERVHGPLARFEVIGQQPLSVDQVNAGVDAVDRSPDPAPVIDPITRTGPREHAPSQQLTQDHVMVNDDICSWLNTRLESLSCVRCRVDYQAAKAA